MNYTNQVTIAILLSFLLFTIAGPKAQDKFRERFSGILK